MIGKAGLGNYAKGVLEYCYYEKNKMTEKQREKLSSKDVRGEMVYVQNLALDYKKDGRIDLDYLTKQFVHNRNANQKLNKHVWHQTFSFPPQEKVSNETIRKICESFSEEFGFKDNQMIAFIHKDKPHQHFHIVANRIAASGKNTADHFNNYRRTGDFCRNMEKEHGLILTPEMMHKRDFQKKEIKEEKTTFKERLVHEIPLALKDSSNFNVFTSILRKKKIQCDIGRGISFIDKNTKEKIKGSDVSREYSLGNLHKQFDNKVKVQSVGMSL